MDVLPVNNFGAGLNDLEAIAQLLGLNNWDLLPASYNGVTFHMVMSGIGANLNQYNPLAGPMDAAISYYRSGNLQNSLFGTPNSDNSTLPYGTLTVASQFVDQLKRKLVRHPSPGLNGDVLEDLGFGAEVIEGTGIIFGDAYYTAYYNILQYFTNDNLAQSKSKNVLVHPIKGTLNAVFLESYRITHSSERYKALMFNFSFRCSEPVSTMASPSTSLEQQLSTYLSLAQGIYGGLSSAIKDINLLGSVL